MEKKEEVIAMYSESANYDSYVEDLLEGNNDEFNKKSAMMDADKKRELAEKWAYDNQDNEFEFDFFKDDLWEFYLNLPTNWFEIDGEVKRFNDIRSKNDSLTKGNLFWFLAKPLNSVTEVVLSKIDENNDYVLIRLSSQDYGWKSPKSIYCLKHDPEDDGRMISDFTYEITARLYDMYQIRKTPPGMILRLENEIKGFFAEFSMTEEIMNALRKHNLYAIVKESINRLKNLPRVKFAEDYMNQDIDLVFQRIMDMLDIVCGRNGLKQ